jgi:hypothetical protein
MTLRGIKKEMVGLFVFGVVVIILVILGRIDWLGYKAVDTAESKCMMAYLNLKQVVFELPANEGELSEFVEDVCSTEKGRLNIPPGGIWIWQARFWQSEDGKWFWQNYERQRAKNLILTQRLTRTAHMIEAKTDSIMGEVIREKREKQDRWDAILAEIKAAPTISIDDNEK